MTTMTMQHKAAVNKGAEKNRCSLRDRFYNYFEENGAQIVCGMLALNGRSDAYKLYAQLTAKR